MIYLEPKSTTPLTVVSCLVADCWIAARLHPDGSSYRVTSGHLPIEKSPQAAFARLREYAAEKSLLCIDLEICVAGGVSYRLQGDEYQPDRSYIKHEAPAKSTVCLNKHGKPAISGQVSWQKYTAYEDAGKGWPSVVKEWTRLWLQYRAEQDAEAAADAAAVAGVGSTPSPDAAPPCAALVPAEPQVLPPEAAPVPDQDEYASRVVNFHVAGQQHASAAVFCAAAAGAVMLQRKKALGWGKGFQQWKENLTLPSGEKISVRTASNYMALATEMVSRIKRLQADGANRQVVAYLPEGQVSGLELLASFDPSAMNDLHQKAVAEAVKQVTNEQSLFELYNDWGIVKERPRLGGDHGGGAAVAEKAKEPMKWKQELILATWTELHRSIRAFVIEHKRHVFLPPQEVKNGIASLKDCVRVMMEVNANE